MTIAEGMISRNGPGQGAGSLLRAGGSLRPLPITDPAVFVITLALPAANTDYAKEVHLA